MVLLEGCVGKIHDRLTKQTVVVVAVGAGEGVPQTRG